MAKKPTGGLIRGKKRKKRVNMAKNLLDDLPGVKRRKFEEKMAKKPTGGAIIFLRENKNWKTKTLVTSFTTLLLTSQWELLLGCILYRPLPDTKPNPPFPIIKPYWQKPIMKKKGWAGTAGFVFSELFVGCRIYRPVPDTKPPRPVARLSKLG